MIFYSLFDTILYYLYIKYVHYAIITFKCTLLVYTLSIFRYHFMFPNLGFNEILIRLEKLAMNVLSLRLIINY